MELSGISIGGAGAGASPLGGSHTAEYLIDMWASTQLAAYIVGEICLNLVKDGVTIPSIEALSRIGCSGLHPGNARRDLGRLSDEPHNKLPQPYPVETYCKAISTKGTKSLVKSPISFTPPHALFSAIHEHYPEEFALRLAGESPTAISDFWDGMDPMDPRVRHHPVRAKARYRERCVPLKLWSDKAPYGKGSKRSINVSELTSQLGTGESLDRCYMMWAVPQGINNTTGPDVTHTLRPLYKAFAWSMLALLSGRWPYVDWNGNSWDPSRHKWHTIPAANAGKPLFVGSDIIFAVLALTVDLDEFCNTYKLRHFNGVPLCCFSCGADCSDAGPMRHTDHRPTAPWRASCITHDEFMLLFGSLHILWTLGLGLSIGNCIYDVMHVVCLGVLQLFLGASLVHVYQDGLSRVHGTAKQRQDFLWLSLVASYDHLRTPNGERIPHSKFSAVLDKGCASDFPDMHCKAAHARHLLHAMNHLVCVRLDLDIGAFRSLRLCLTRLSRFYDICMGSGHYIQEAYQTEAKDCIGTFLLHQNMLNAHFRTAAHPRLLYGITIKSHLLAHISLYIQYFNPVSYWCYIDEDFVGKIAAMALREARGRNMITIANAVASRYRLRIFLRYDVRRRRNNGLSIVNFSVDLA